MSGSAKNIARATGRAALAVALAGSAAAYADTSPAESADAAGPRQKLEQLNRETQALYAEVQGTLVRVQLPTPRGVNDASAEGSPLDKYKDLDPQVRRQLEQQQIPAGADAAGPSRPAPARTPSATRPAQAQPAGDAPLRVRGRIIVVPPLVPPQQDASRDAVLGARLEFGAEPAPGGSAFTPNQVGVLLDQGGHVLIPLYVEKEACAGQPLRLAGRDGRVVEATFIGSDRQTHLTVLRLNQIVGTPVRFGPPGQDDDRPAGGSLLMYVSPDDGAGRLGLWNGAAGAAGSGLVFHTDGRFAGIARYGQFLGARDCQRVAAQIADHGAVRRATLGVVVREIQNDGPLRRQRPALGGRAALRIDQVVPGSAAEQAGLRAGDMLLALAGGAVYDLPGLAAAIAGRTGQTQLRVLRDGKVVDVVLDLQPR